jgi:mycothiol synthase
MSASLSKEFTVRPATMDDLDAALALFNACSIAYTGKARLEETELRGDWEMPGFDLEKDTRMVFAPNGGMVGYVAVWDSAPHARLHADVHVYPDRTGQGIGAYLGGWAEQRALQAVPLAPEGVRVALQQTVPQADAMAGASLSRLGYRVVRHFFEMVIEMDAPPVPSVPESIVIRPFVRETEDRALVHVLRDAFKDHWGYVEKSFEEDYEEWVHWMDDDPSFDQSLWFVAVEDDEIVGCSICYDVTGEGPDVGAVETLGVRRPWRRRGIALALLRHSFGELYRRGRTTVTLGVDAQSLTGALHLYEKAGMHVRHQYDRYEKELRPGVDLSTRELEY